MMRSCRSFFVAALAALAGMLFLQAALAFAGCELPGRSAAMAHAMQQSAMPDCHEADQNATLCLTHCQSDGQTVGKSQLNLPDLSAQAAPALRIWKAAPRIERRFALPVQAAAGPPPRILFQSFLL